MIVKSHRVAESKAFFYRVIYAFPFQLVFMLFKKNVVLTAYWALLFAFIAGQLGAKWGAPFLFLDPEYMGRVSFFSFLIMGIAIGGFIMAINMSSYVLNAFRFPFLATLGNPFGKFILNNCIIPLAFVITYVFRFVNFQLHYEFQPMISVMKDLMGFLLGISSIIGATILYFYYTNKDVYKLYGIQTAEKYNFTDAPLKQTNEKARRLRSWRVETYVSWPPRIKLVRGTAHYDKEAITRVFRQNQLNAAVIQLAVFVLFLLLGAFREFPFFKIPAAASVVILFSLIIMILSALRYWLRGWATALFILGFLVFNYFSGFESLNPRNKAYGLEYSIRNSYNTVSISTNIDSAKYRLDIDSTTAILERWKSKVQGNSKQKPKIILLNVSGGGLRAATWSFRVIQLCDSMTKGAFFKNTQLIAGASGGMIGASYFRELYLQGILKHPMEHSLYSRHYYNDMGKDILNPIIFSITINDIFLRLQQFKIGNEWHKKDRAYAFEKQLNENLHMAFTKTLKDYQQPERDALIPMMIFTPTIVNDGRRLFISPQNISYLCNKTPANNFTYLPTYDGIEYTRFFHPQKAENTLFTSILRMNSTFPYIQPGVSLPTTPVVEAMDAGVVDNFGTRTSLKFMYSFKQWLQENTSGIIFVQIRDTPLEPSIDNQSAKTLLANLNTPMEIFYGNFAKEHLYTQDELMNYVSSYPGKVSFIIFQLPAEQEKVSLSWHLTSREKKYIYNAPYSEENLQAMKKLKALLKVKE